MIWSPKRGVLYGIPYTFALPKYILTFHCIFSTPLIIDHTMHYSSLPFVLFFFYRSKKKKIVRAEGSAILHFTSIYSG